MEFLIILFVGAIFFFFNIIKYFVCWGEYYILISLTGFLTHNYISIRVSTGPSIFFWDILAIVLVIYLYTKFLDYLHVKSPVINKVFHYIMSIISSMSTIVGVSTLVLIANKNTRVDAMNMELLPLLNDPKANIIAYICFALLLAIPICKYRLNYYGYYDDKTFDLSKYFDKKNSNE